MWITVVPISKDKLMGSIPHGESNSNRIPAISLPVAVAPDDSRSPRSVKVPLGLQDPPSTVLEPPSKAMAHVDVTALPNAPLQLSVPSYIEATVQTYRAAKLHKACTGGSFDTKFQAFINRKDTEPPAPTQVFKDYRAPASTGGNFLFLTT